MASSYYKLNIEDRTLIRTKGAKVLRKNDSIPGVLYYKGEETINVAVNKLTLYQAIQSGKRIYEIEIEGDTQYVMIKELQYHPVNDDIIHIDLMRVRRSEKIKIAVPLILVGDAEGIKEGGVLSQAMTQIEIECFPTDVPKNIELDITELEMNNSYSVADLKVVDDVTILSASDLNIVSIQPPAAEEELLEEEEMIEGEEMVEGEEGTQAPDEENKKENTGDSAEES
jgi:large subunit ribosomal protein L25